MNERPDIKRIKSELAAAIVGLIDDRKLTDMAASERLTLAPTEIARLRAGDLTGFSVDHMISVLNAFDQHVGVYVEPGPAPTPTKSTSADHRSIWEKIEEIAARIPPEEWEKLPTDLAANHDHYLYGTPKRD